MAYRLYGWGKAINDLWAANWWQLSSGALLAGFVSGLSVASLIPDGRWLDRHGSLIRLLLYIAGVGVLCAIGLTAAHQYDSPWRSLCFRF